jgi:hypothetical protein
MFLAVATHRHAPSSYKSQNTNGNVHPFDRLFIIYISSFVKNITFIILKNSIRNPKFLEKIAVFGLQTLCFAVLSFLSLSS